MYLINKEENEIAKLESCSFTELGFREREHLNFFSEVLEPALNQVLKGI